MNHVLAIYVNFRLLCSDMAHGGWTPPTCSMCVIMQHAGGSFSNGHLFLLMHSVFLLLCKAATMLRAAHLRLKRLLDVQHVGQDLTAQQNMRTCAE